MHGLTPGRVSPPAQHLPDCGRWRSACWRSSSLPVFPHRRLLSALPTRLLPAETISWSYSDLRLIDPPDATHPEHDLLAVYVRHLPGESAGNPPGSSRPRTHIRLDFLDLPIQNQSQLYLALDFAPGGVRKLPIPGKASLDWDVLVQILPAHRCRLSTLSSSQFQTWLYEFYAIPGWIRLSSPSTLLPFTPLRGRRPPEVGVQVFIVPRDATVLADQSSPTTSYATPPKPAHTLLAFWNTFPAYTPARHCAVGMALTQVRSAGGTGSPTCSRTASRPFHSPRLAGPENPCLALRLGLCRGSRAGG